MAGLRDSLTPQIDNIAEEAQSLQSNFTPVPEFTMAPEPTYAPQVDSPITRYDPERPTGFAAGVAAGVEDLQGTANVLTAGAQYGLGFDQAAIESMNRAATYFERGQNRLENKSLSEMNSVGDFTEALKEQAGRMLPTLTAAIAGGGAYGAAAQGLLGSLAKKGLGKKARNAAATFGAIQGSALGEGGEFFANMALDTPERRAWESRMGLDVEGDVAKDAEGYVMSLSEQLGTNLMGAHASGALNLMPILGAVKKLPTGNGASKFKQILNRALATGATESVTESLQTGIEYATANFINENRGVMTPEFIEELKTAAALAFPLGFAGGGAGATLRVAQDSLNPISEEQKDEFRNRMVEQIMSALQERQSGNVSAMDDEEYEMDRNATDRQSDIEVGMMDLLNTATINPDFLSQIPLAATANLTATPTQDKDVDNGTHTYQTLLEYLQPLIEDGSVDPDALAKSFYDLIQNNTIKGRRDRAQRWLNNLERNMFEQFDDGTFVATEPSVATELFGGYANNSNLDEVMTKQWDARANIEARTQELQAQYDAMIAKMEGAKNQAWRTRFAKQAGEIKAQLEDVQNQVRTDVNRTLYEGGINDNFARLQERIREIVGGETDEEFQQRLSEMEADINKRLNPGKGRKKRRLTKEQGYLNEIKARINEEAARLDVTDEQMNQYVDAVRNQDPQTLSEMAEDKHPTISSGSEIGSIAKKSGQQLGSYFSRLKQEKQIMDDPTNIAPITGMPDYQGMGGAQTILSNIQVKVPNDPNNYAVGEDLIRLDWKQLTSGTRSESPLVTADKVTKGLASSPWHIPATDQDGKTVYINLSNLGKMVMPQLYATKLSELPANGMKDIWNGLQGAIGALQDQYGITVDPDFATKFKDKNATAGYVKLGQLMRAESAQAPEGKRSTFGQGQKTEEFLKDEQTEQRDEDIVDNPNAEVYIDEIVRHMKSGHTLRSTEDRMVARFTQQDFDYYRNQRNKTDLIKRGAARLKDKEFDLFVTAVNALFEHFKQTSKKQVDDQWDVEVKAVSSKLDREVRRAKRTAAGRTHPSPVPVASLQGKKGAKHRISEQEIRRIEATKAQTDLRNELEAMGKEMLTRLGLKKVANLFKMHTFDEAKKAGYAEKVLTNVNHGFAGIGKNNVGIYLNPRMSRQDQYRVFAHELGHIITHRAYYSADPTVKKAIAEDYVEWLDKFGFTEDERKAFFTDKGYADLDTKAVQARRKALGLDVSSVKRVENKLDYQYYSMSFDEYMAERVGWWLLNDAKPQSVAEKYFKKLAEAFRTLWSIVSGERVRTSDAQPLKPGDPDTTQRYSEKQSKAVTDWLDSLWKYRDKTDWKDSVKLFADVRSRMTNLKTYIYERKSKAEKEELKAFLREVQPKIDKARAEYQQWVKDQQTLESDEAIRRLEVAKARVEKLINDVAKANAVIAKQLRKATNLTNLQPFEYAFNRAYAQASFVSDQFKAMVDETMPYAEVNSDIYNLMVEFHAYRKQVDEARTNLYRKLRLNDLKRAHVEQQIEVLNRRQEQLQIRYKKFLKAIESAGTVGVEGQTDLQRTKLENLKKMELEKERGLKAIEKKYLDARRKKYAERILREENRMHGTNIAYKIGIEDYNRMYSKDVQYKPRFKREPKKTKDTVDAIAEVGLTVDEILATAQIQSDDPNLQVVGFLNVFENVLNAEERAAILKATDSYYIRKQLYDLYPPQYHQDMLDNDMLNAAYAFVAYREGVLDVGKNTKSLFHKILLKIAEILGIVTQSQQAASIFDFMIDENNALRHAKAADPYIFVGLDRQLYNNGLQRAFGAARPTLDFLGKQIMRVVAPVNLRFSKIPAIQRALRIVRAEQDRPYQSTSYQESRDMWTAKLSHALEVAFGEEVMNDSRLQRALLRNMQLKKTSKDKNVAAAQKGLRAWLDAVRGYAKSRGVDIKFVKDYIPLVFDPEYITENRENFKAILVKYMPDDSKQWKIQGGSKEAHADMIIDAIISEDGGTEFEFDSEHGMTNPLMDSGRERSLKWLTDNEEALKEIVQYQSDDLFKVMGTYLHQVVRRSEYVKSFGENGATFEALMEQAKRQGATPKEIKEARDYMDGILGLRAREFIKKHPKWNKAIQVMSVFQAMRTLSMAVFGSMSDIGGLILRGGLQNAAFSMVDGLNDVNYQYAEDIGAVERTLANEIVASAFDTHGLTGKAAKTSNWFFKVNGMNMWTRATRSMGVALANRMFYAWSLNPDAHIDDLREMGLKPSDLEFYTVDQDHFLKVMDTSEEMRLMKELVDPSVSENQKKINQKKLDRNARRVTAINRFVNSAILRPEATSRPNWANDPRAHLFFQLKGFMYKFWDTFHRRIYNDLMYSDKYNTSLALLAVVPIFMFSEFLRDLIQHLGTGDPWKEDWGISGWAYDSAKRAGVFGPGELLLGLGEDVQYGNILGESFAGPAAEWALDWGRVAIGHRSADTMLMKSLPGQNLFYPQLKVLSGDG